MRDITHHHKVILVYHPSIQTRCILVPMHREPSIKLGLDFFSFSFHKFFISTIPKSTTQKKKRKSFSSIILPPNNDETKPYYAVPTLCLCCDIGIVFTSEASQKFCYNINSNSKFYQHQLYPTTTPKQREDGWYCL